MIHVIYGQNDIKSWMENNGDFGKKLLNDYADSYNLETIGRTSKIRLKFICSTCNMEYFKTPGHISRGQGCPYCNTKSNHVENIPENSTRRLVIAFPNLALEYDKNDNDIDVKDLLVTSNKKVWWKCNNCGKKWQAYISNRTKHNSGCPYCNQGNQGSLMEYALYLILKEHFNNVLYQFKAKNGMTFDIGIPDICVVIEYQGRYYHNNKYNKYDVEKRDIDKRKYIEAVKEITYMTINETYGGEKIKRINNDIYFNADNTNKYNALLLIINEINNIIHSEIKVRKDIEQYAISMRKIKDVDESLGKLYPNIAIEWDAQKNGELTPFKIKPKSNKKVYWKCNVCNFEWITSPAHRVVDGTLCPKCVAIRNPGSGTHMIIDGINDLKSLNKRVAADYASDINVIPLEKISIYSNRKVTWRCSNCGHLYEDKVIYRTARNHNCPICGQ